MARKCEFPGCSRENDGLRYCGYHEELVHLLVIYIDRLAELSNIPTTRERITGYIDEQVLEVVFLSEAADANPKARLKQLMRSSVTTTGLARLSGKPLSSAREWIKQKSMSACKEKGELSIKLRKAILLFILLNEAVPLTDTARILCSKRSSLEYLVRKKGLGPHKHPLLRSIPFFWRDDLPGVAAELAKIKHK